MRCNNCGWENPDGNQKCEKCNALLQSGGTSNPSPSLHSTVRESAPFEPKAPRTVIDKTLRDNIDKTISVPEPEVKPQQKPEPAPGYSPPTTGGFGGGTVNPYANMGPGGYVPIAYCLLKPVIFPGENPNHAPKPVNIKGDYTELNRQMIDPDNPTITSQVQAVLTHKDGKWYIQNQSAHKTTFVLADEPIEVKSGDVILMGNRTFVFEED